MAWQLWQRCQAFNKTPSDLVGLENPLMSYYFDRGIWVFGTYVQREVDKAGEAASRGARPGNKEALSNGARTRTLARLCGEDITKTTTGFRTPGNMKAKP